MFVCYDANLTNHREIRQKHGKDWGRPECDTSGDISFQQIDLDKTLESESGCDPRPVIRIYGTDKNGSSIACFVQNFRPYFYVQAPEDFTDDFCGQFGKELNDKIINEQKSGSFRDLRKAVMDVELCLKENIYGYSSKGKQKFLKITIALWQLMTPSKKVLETGWDVETENGRTRRQFSTFESNIDYEIRFMVDCKVRGASWITIPAGKHAHRLKFETTCAYECTVDYRDIIAHEPEGEWAGIAPMRILSYDIECAGRKGIFPEPEHDPVIQIATMVQCQGRNIFN